MLKKLFSGFYAFFIAFFTATVAIAAAVQLTYSLNGVVQQSPLAAIGSGSDCGITGGGNSAQIQCLVWDNSVSGTNPILLSCNQFGGFIIATGGGIVPIILPDAPCRGRGSIIEFSTDGNTGLSLTVQTTTKTRVQGPVPPINMPLVIAAGHTGWAQFGANNTYNIGIN